MSVRVVARARAKKGQEAALRALLLGMLEPTRKESGCIRYELCESEKDAAELFMLEEWASDAALDAHMKQPHLLDLFAKIPALVAAPPEIMRLRVVR